MLNSKIRILFACIICGFLFWNISIAGDKKEEMAAESAKAWLTMIDDGKYAEQRGILFEIIQHSYSVPLHS